MGGSTEDFTKNIRARAVCGCGDDEFHAFIFRCGGERFACIACGAWWETPVGGKPEYEQGEATMEGRRDVGAYVVSTPSGRAWLEERLMWQESNPGAREKWAEAWGIISDSGRWEKRGE